MRIPSELYGESLYGQKSARRRKPSSQAWRRVIRLLVVMALILVVMRQAARSGVYEVFFATAERKQVLTPSVKRTVAGQSTPIMTQPMRSKFDAWAAAQSVERLATSLADWLGGGPLELDYSVKGNRKDFPLLETESGRSLVALAIQQHLITAMKDGTVWRAADGPGLTATLAMHTERSKRFDLLNQTRPRGVTAGVLPLLQQPEVYLGETVIAGGELVKIEKIHASENLFEIDSYWNLWLMPLDASNRPWLVVVPELPPGLASLTDVAAPGTNPASMDGDDESLTQFWTVKSPRPKIEVDGEFLKRLSYRSAAGAELTPVVAGHVTTIYGNGNTLVATATGQLEPNEAKHRKSTGDISLIWILVSAAGGGLLIAIWVMWRTAKINREMRRRRNRHPVQLCLAWTLLSISLSTPLSAQSLMDLLPGYDAKRLDGLVWQLSPTSERPSVNTGELAKLIYRIDRLSEVALHTRVDRSATPPVVGDAVMIEGKVSKTVQLPIDADLQDYLEFKKIELIWLPDIDGAPHLLISRTLPSEAVMGDRISGMGVRVRIPIETREMEKSSDNLPPLGFDRIRSSGIVDVAGQLNWIPAHPKSAADAVLANSGVDLSQLGDLDKLDRQPLSDSDSSLFYPMIGAADIQNVDREKNAGLFEEIHSMRKSKLDVSPVDLLENPINYTGEWIRLDVETVRVTRVVVQSPERQRQVGSEHYYEIDAVGDLGNVQLEIEVPGGERVTMENRYPVTIITAHLPDFLKPSDGDDEQLVFTGIVPIRVEGFFYRLWSYESDLMQSHGGKQFAPLIIAGVIEDRRSNSTDPMGVQAIGNIAAIGVIAAIVGVIIFGVITRRGDRRARQRHP